MNWFSWSSVSTKHHNRQKMKKITQSSTTGAATVTHNAAFQFLLSVKHNDALRNTTTNLTVLSGKPKKIHRLNRVGNSGCPFPDHHITRVIGAGCLWVNAAVHSRAAVGTRTTGVPARGRRTTASFEGYRSPAPAHKWDNNIWQTTCGGSETLAAAIATSSQHIKHTGAGRKPRHIGYLTSLQPNSRLPPVRRV